MGKTENKNVAVYVDTPNIYRSNIDYSYKNNRLAAYFKKEYKSISKFNEYWALGSSSPYHRTDPVKLNQSIFNMAKLGITMVPAPSFGHENPKNITDTMITVDMIEDLHMNDSIDVFVIVTSDCDFIPVFKKVIERGKEAVLVLVSESGNLEKFCDNMGVEILNLSTIMRLQENGYGGDQEC